jgi:hypothetical protein
MSGYSFTTPVWEGGKWAVPPVSEVRAARRANGPEDQPPDDLQWDKEDTGTPTPGGISHAGHGQTSREPRTY